MYTIIHSFLQIFPRRNLGDTNRKPYEKDIYLIPFQKACGTLIH